MTDGEWEAERKRAGEDTILASGAKALAMVFGGTPEQWREYQQDIIEKRKQESLPKQDTKWSVQ